MIPRLPVEHFQAAQFFVLFRIGFQQHEFAQFGQHQQLIAVRQQQHLAAAVAPFFPGAFASGQIDAPKDVVVEAVEIAVVFDEVVEVRLHVTRRPLLRHRVIVLAWCDVDAPSPRAHARAEQKAGRADRQRLHDAIAFEFPGMFPPLGAGVRFDRRESGIGQHQHDRLQTVIVQLGGTVAVIAGR